MITEEQRAIRKSGIGGSDVAGILGLSPWTTPRSVYEAKVGDPEDLNNEAIYWGSVEEPIIIDRFELEHPDFKVERDPETIRHPDHEWMIANVDGIIATPEGTQEILEIKTASSATHWGRQGTDEIPEYYRCQVAWYMAILDVDSARVAVKIGSSDYREYVVYRDAEFEAFMIEKCKDFWFNHVVPRIEPPLSEKEVLDSVSSSEAKGNVEADDNIYAMIEELRLIKDEEKSIAERKKLLETAIKKYIGKNESLSFKGSVLATWKSTTGSRFNSKKFETEHPEMVEQYQTKVTTRRFLIK